jgi:hypothetical protein
LTTELRRSAGVFSNGPPAGKPPVRFHGRRRRNSESAADKQPPKARGRWLLSARWAPGVGAILPRGRVPRFYLQTITKVMAGSKTEKFQPSNQWTERQLDNRRAEV